MPATACGFRRFRLINFTGRIYSGNGKLLQGDIYRGGADGRAAWREIKSDCLGKSEPSTRAIGTAAAVALHRIRPEHLPTSVPAESLCCIPAAKRRNTKNIRIETLTDPLSSPAVSLLATVVSTHPNPTTKSATGRHYRTGARAGRRANGRAGGRARSLTPESISRTAIKHRDVSSTLRATAHG